MQVDGDGGTGVKQGPRNHLLKRGRGGWFRRASGGVGPGGIRCRTLGIRLSTGGLPGLNPKGEAVLQPLDPLLGGRHLRRVRLSTAIMSAWLPQHSFINASESTARCLKYRYAACTADVCTSSSARLPVPLSDRVPVVRAEARADGRHVVTSARRRPQGSRRERAGGACPVRPGVGGGGPGGGAGRGPARRGGRGRAPAPPGPGHGGGSGEERGGGGAEAGGPERRGAARRAERWSGGRGRSCTALQLHYCTVLYTVV